MQNYMTQDDVLSKDATRHAQGILGRQFASGTENIFVVCQQARYECRGSYRERDETRWLGQRCVSPVPHKCCLESNLLPKRDYLVCAHVCASYMCACYMNSCNLGAHRNLPMCMHAQHVSRAIEFGKPIVIVVETEDRFFAWDRKRWYMCAPHMRIDNDTGTEICAHTNRQPCVPALLSQNLSCLCACVGRTICVFETLRAVGPQAGCKTHSQTVSGTFRR